MAALGVLAACSAGSKSEVAQDRSFAVKGTVRVVFFLDTSVPEAFLEMSEYYDRKAETKEPVTTCEGLPKGSRVVIKDASGDTVGVAALDDGRVIANGSACTFPYEIKGLDPSKFYEVTIPSTDYSETLTQAELKRKHTALNIRLTNYG